MLEITSSGKNVGTSNVTVTELAESAMIVGKVTGSSTTPVATSGTFNVKGSKGNVDISFTAGNSTIDSIVKSINNNSSVTGVSASYDPNSGALYLSSTDVGGAAEVNVSGDIALFGFASTSDKGSDAVYTVNGVSLTSSSNSVFINGTQVVLKGKGQASIGSVTDRSGVVDKIKNFVEQYNALIDAFSTATTTRKNRDYAPLTDEEKEAMSESQIEKWEAKAKEGTLYNDSILKDTLSSMRNSLNTPLNAAAGEISLL